MASILIVDDEETHARALARFLERRRYGASVAVSATQARAALAKSRPDLVLLDQRLGDDDPRVPRLGGPGHHPGPGRQPARRLLYLPRWDEP